MIFSASGRWRLQEVKRTRRERLAFIEFRLWFLGDVGRQDLISRFGIAPAVATRDLAAYRELAPNNVDFDGTRKRYIPTRSFRPSFSFEPERVLSALSRGFGDGLHDSSQRGYVACEFPVHLNLPDLSVLAVVTRAIHNKQVVRLTYHSPKHEPNQREVVPFALVDTGRRWHTRAFDRRSGEFRDLVMTRIENPSLIPESVINEHEERDRDIEWARIVELELVPHPRQSRPDVVAKDFGITGTALKLRIRAAMVGYFLQQWSVDCSADHSLDPHEFRLWLRDPLVLYGVESAILAPGYEAGDSRPRRSTHA